MNIATLYARKGHPGLVALAEKAGGLKVSYLQRLVYRPETRPSIERAQVLIEASKKLWPDDGVLTIEGLANPVDFKEARKDQIRLGVEVYTRPSRLPDRAEPAPERKPRRRKAATSEQASAA